MHEHLGEGLDGSGIWDLRFGICVAIWLLIGIWDWDWDRDFNLCVYCVFQICVYCVFQYVCSIYV